MAHERQLSLTVFLDKMKRIYRPMSILVRKEQEKYFFRLKNAVHYGKVKRQAGAEVSRFEVSSLEGFFFRSQQLTYKIVYICIDVISSEENTTPGKYETPKPSIAINKFLPFSVLRHAATGKFSGKQ